MITRDFLVLSKGLVPTDKPYIHKYTQVNAFLTRGNGKARPTILQFNPSLLDKKPFLSKSDLGYSAFVGNRNGFGQKIRP